jgi:integrase
MWVKMWVHPDMALIERLTALKIGRVSKPGYYCDGGGLYLQVGSAGAKSWIYRFTLRGQTREMGLGSLSAISLAEARKKAIECRKQRLEGIDPIEERRARRRAAMLDAAKAITFKVAAERYISANKIGWRNAKHEAQWTSTLTTYAYPIIGELSVQSIDTDLVVQILQPIWTAKPETAVRVRGRIEMILDWATAHGFRGGENPARWRGHIDHILPARAKVSRVKHHAALPYAELPEFLDKLREQEGTGARALEFTVLTAARTGETIGAMLDEINFAERVWIIPAGRMKAEKEHRVPLSGRALAIIEEVRRARSDEDKLFFPGGKAGKPLSNMAMTEVLRRMGRGDITVHGFRSSFRDWAAERTNFPKEVAEMALAHTIGNKVEAAYRRGDLFEKRRRLMAEWERYCSSTKKANGKVIPMKQPA